MQSLRTLAITAALLAGAASAQAALINRGNGLIYDTVFNITWLADMNYALTSGYAITNNTGATGNFSDSYQIRTNGLMGWDAATKWASDLVFEGLSDWRMPTVNPNDVTGGELGHLFITDLGNQPGTAVTNQTGDTALQKANYALFSNVKSDVYWSGLVSASDSSDAWYFHGTYGGQSTDWKRGALYALAVHDGDVAGTAPGPASVPEPQTLALTMLALGAAMVARRKRPL